MTAHIDEELFACASCGSPVFDDELFCESCGVRAHGSPVLATENHRERDLGFVAAVTDRGHRRQRNEDAFAVAAGPGRFVAVVCDGVATTANSDQAAQAAAAAVHAALEPLVSSAPWPGSTELAAVLEDAFAAAQRAVALVDPDEPGGSALPPSTTLVVAVGDGSRAVVANVGDSRAYWLAADSGRSRCLTVDDSGAQDLIAQGVPPAEAQADPQAHMITRWIGADADNVSPTITEHELTEPGILLLCSDGLWNYFEEPARLAALLPPGNPAPIAVARIMTEAALSAGGSDNIAIVTVRPGRRDATQNTAGRPGEDPT
jgi:serine/threonine protein phosphatase PrpC